MTRIDILDKTKPNKQKNPLSPIQSATLNMQQVHRMTVHINARTQTISTQRMREANRRSLHSWPWKVRRAMPVAIYELI